VTDSVQSWQLAAQAEAGQYAARAIETRDLVEEFVVRNEADQQFAAGLLGEIKGQIKAIEARRKSITEPLNRALREVNDLFRPARDALEAGERAIKGAIARYLAEREAERRAVLAEASRARTVIEAEAALARVEPQTAPPAGVSVRRVRKFEIVDADVVPREYCSPDPSKITLAVQEGVEVPGVRVFEDAVVAARGAP
jgi:hypothetical protein